MRPHPCPRARGYKGEGRCDKGGGKNKGPKGPGKPGNKTLLFLDKNANPNYKIYCKNHMTCEGAPGAATMTKDNKCNKLHSTQGYFGEQKGLFLSCRKEDGDNAAWWAEAGNAGGGWNGE